MPHIIVEHTKDVSDVQKLLINLHKNLASQETVVLNSLKSRSIAVGHAVVGNGETDSLLHITLKLLPGRSDELLLKMTSDLQAIAADHCTPATRVTVEAATLHAPSYRN